MKKLIFVLLLSSIASGAFANNAAVATVQRMYAEARTGTAGFTVVEKYADISLKKAIRASNQYTEQTGYICTDADPMWANQDPQEKAKVSVTALGGNKVKASFKQYGKNVTRIYTLNCNGNSCAVSYVSGLKHELMQCR